MKWEVTGKESSHTECGKYFVTGGAIAGGKMAFLGYWRAPEGAQVIHRAECWDEAGDRAAARMECREACEAHAGPPLSREGE